MLHALEQSGGGFRWEPPLDAAVVTPHTDDIPGFASLWDRASRDVPFHTLGLDCRRIPVDDGIYRRLCLYRRLVTGRDLIEATTCRVYDFGMGGDDVSYKARYGTRSVACNSY